MNMEKTPPIEEMIRLINDKGLNNKLIADYLGIKQGTFSLKINNLRYNKFTKSQIEKIWEYIQNIETNINNLKNN